MTTQPLLKGNFQNLTGVRFGKLTVINFAGQTTSPSGSKRTIWNVKCDCGSAIKCDAGHLRSGSKDNCGCVVKYGQHTITHGASIGGRPTSEYNIWSSMKARVSNPKSCHFALYGGRGITVCERWKNSFEAFLADMGPRPSKSHSIDRINTDGNYEPSNCQWSTPLQQNNNRRCNIILTYQGITLTASQWALRLSINPKTILRRIRNGWDAEKALTSKIQTKSNRK